MVTLVNAINYKMKPRRVGPIHSRRGHPDFKDEKLPFFKNAFGDQTLQRMFEMKRPNQRRHGRTA